MEEEFSVANTNVADEHVWALSFYKCHVYVLQLSDLIWGLKTSLPGQGRGHGVSTGAFQPDQGSITARSTQWSRCRSALVGGRSVLGWLGAEQLRSVPELTAEETRGWVICFPGVTSADGVWAQQGTGRRLPSSSPLLVASAAHSQRCCPYVPLAVLQLSLLVAGLGWRSFRMLS